MMSHTVEIPMKLITLNEYIGKNRCNVYVANKYKQDTEAEIGLYVRKLPKIINPVKVHITWVEENKRRDPDNIVAVGKKLILDSLIKNNIIKNDGHKNIKGFVDDFEFAEETKIILRLIEVLEDG